MRIVIYTLFLILSYSTLAQNTPVTNAPRFVRVYDLDNKKIGKGVIIGLNDSALFVQQKNTVFRFPYTDIGQLKTKRSYVHDLFVSMGSSGTLFGVFGLMNYNENRIGTVSRGQETTAGFVGGAMLGALVCSVYQIFKQDEKIKINGNYNDWLNFKNRFFGMSLIVPIQGE